MVELDIAVIVLGLILGSFLNVCIYRLPRGESIVAPRSYCPVCNTGIKSLDLIPVASWLLLQGRCRKCGTAISVRYVLVEILTAALFWGCYQQIGWAAQLAPALAITAVLIVITFIDYDYQLILDKVLVFFATVGLVANLVLQTNSLQDMLIAGAVGGAIFLVIAIVSRGGMGGGDIKFAAALGLCFGFKVTMFIVFLSFLLGGVGGVLLLALKVKKRKDYIPFGPFMAIAAYMGMLYGTEIVGWYLELMR